MAVQEARESQARSIQLRKPRKLRKSSQPKQKRKPRKSRKLKKPGMPRRPRKPRKLRIPRKRPLKGHKNRLVRCRSNTF